MFYDRKKSKSILPGLEGFGSSPGETELDTYVPPTPQSGNSGTTGVVTSGGGINPNTVGNQAGGTYIPSGGANYTGTGTAPPPYSPPSPVPRVPVVSPPLVNTVVPSSTGGQSVAAAVAAYQAQLAAQAQALRDQLLAQRAAAAKPATPSAPPAPPAYVSPGESAPPIPPPLIPAPSTKQVAVAQSFSTRFPVKTAIIQPVKQGPSTWVNGPVAQTKRLAAPRPLNNGERIASKIGAGLLKSALVATGSAISAFNTSGSSSKLAPLQALLNRYKFTEAGITADTVNTGISDTNEMTRAQFNEYVKANEFTDKAIKTLIGMSGGSLGDSKSDLQKKIESKFGAEVARLYLLNTSGYATAGEKYLAARDLYNDLNGVSYAANIASRSAAAAGAGAGAFKGSASAIKGDIIRSEVAYAAGSIYDSTGDSVSNLATSARNALRAFSVSQPPVVVKTIAPALPSTSSVWTQAGLADEIKRQQSFVDDTGAASDSSPSAQREVSLLNQLKQQYENKFGGSVASSDAPINYHVNPFVAPLFDQPRKYAPPAPEPIRRAPDYSIEISQLQQRNDTLNQRIAHIVNSPNFDGRTQGQEVQSMLDQIRGNNNYIQDYQSRSVRTLPDAHPAPVGTTDKTVDKVGLTNALIDMNLKKASAARSDAMDALKEEMIKGDRADPDTLKALGVSTTQLADKVTKLDREISNLNKARTSLYPGNGMEGMLGAMGSLGGATRLVVSR